DVIHVFLRRETLAQIGFANVGELVERRPPDPTAVGIRSMLDQERRNFVLLVRDGENQGTRTLAVAARPERGSGVVARGRDRAGTGGRCRGSKLVVHIGAELQQRSSRVQLSFAYGKEERCEAA